MIALNTKKKKIAFIASYPPRKCGIATFTSDLINNMNLAAGGGLEPQVIAMESGSDLEYEQIVKCKIHKNVQYDYVLAAEHLNNSNIDLVFIQHEFGLFGGDGGSYINLLLRRLNNPVITILHTVLDKPSVEYFDSLTGVCKASDKVIVMNKRGISMLRKTYRVPKEKIKLIPHGIPDLSFNGGGYYKQKLGLKGRKTILTFGLLSRNKGIEVMLKALPTIVKADPSILYIVLGDTHPEVLRHEGQSYKFELERIVRNLGLQRNVIFYNQFIENEELFQFLGAADIYVTPYLNKEQLTSGTLAFAVGAGKAIVSTPYWAAEELLAQGRGKLVRFGDSEHMAQSIIEILSNNSLFHKMKKATYEYGRSMIWPNVGQAYWNFFNSRLPSLSISAEASFNVRIRKTSAYKQQSKCQSA